MIDHDGAIVAAHESAHVAAALMLGRRIGVVARFGRGDGCGGATLSKIAGEYDPVTTAADLIVVLLAPLFEVGTRGANDDVRKAQHLGTFTGVDLDAASDRARALVRDPRFRRMHRAVEWGLWEHPVLTGEECELLVALDEEVSHA